MLTKQTPETIRARLTVKAQGVENDLVLTYFNHTPAEFKEWAENPENLKVPDGIDPLKQIDLALAHVNAAVVLYLVKSFDDGTDKAFPLTRDGLIDLEQTWPDTLAGIIRGYHKARGASVEKN